MKILGMGEGELARCLAAVKAIAVADGTFEGHERALLDAAARTLHLDVDVDALEPATPEELAASVRDPEARQRVVQAQIVMALMDGKIEEAELAKIREYARALGVEERRVDNLRQLLAGHHRYVQMDLMRRSPMVSEVLREQYRQKGLGGVWETLGGLSKLHSDPEIAARFVALGELPEGTLGREYFLHMHARGFALPGEATGFPEGFMKHDLCHVLGEYDTGPAGECEVVAFICGFMKSDPFGYLFMITLHMHLGIEIFQGDALGRMDFDPGRVVRALRRGSLVTTDLYDPHFDWWPHFATPIDELRARWNILPKDAIA
jgi:tellurite resistance protein